ncbi:MAG: hypothetical protein CL450_07735 [Acidimicrobiaceae bacterium]|nr:hypothetical protein [Acidimicrobiaceae bacterium]|tara:strand:- start:2392 stop:2733 length:342 start_codon:yes stop_codon:yes gene_type:complete
MRGYTFDRALAVERAKAVSAAFRESQVSTPVAASEKAPPKEKPPVELHRDSLYVTPAPKVPVKVIWFAAGLVFLGVVLWSVYSSIQCRQRVEELEKWVRMLSERQGIYVRHGL